MVRNKDVERKAIDFAKDYYRSQGYTVKEKSRIGCDLTITKMGGEYPIEVKGRTKIWGFINLSMKEVKVLKNNPNARLFEVIINKKTKGVEYAYEFCFGDFIRERPLGYALYPNRTSRNLVYQKS